MKLLSQVTAFLPAILFASALHGQVPAATKTTAASNPVVLKPSQILVKGSVFSDKCKIDDLTFMDESKAVIEGTNEGPVPSTHQIDYDQPAFTVTYNIYATVEEARKGFEASHKKVAENALAQSTPIITDDLGFSFFGWGVVGRNRTKTTLMHNFVMHLQDAFGKLSVDQSNEFFEKVCRPHQQAGRTAQDIKGPGGAARMDQQRW